MSDSMAISKAADANSAESVESPPDPHNVGDGSDSPPEVEAHEEALLEENDNDTDEPLLGSCARCLTRHPQCKYCLENNPRHASILLGVLLPLWGLILVSVIFGLFLANFEGLNEVITNNANLAASHEAALVGNIIGNLTAGIPEMCLRLYLSNRTTSSAILDSVQQVFLENDLDIELFPQLDEWLASLPGQHNITTNVTVLLHFMRICGATIQPLVEQLLRYAANRTDVAADGLTFNWIRCYPQANGLGKLFDSAAYVNMSELQPSAQLEYFTQVWTDDFDQILDQTFNGTAVSRLEAYQVALEQATGEAACELNVVSSVWFWFTIMTTVGYGNQAPVTRGGRSLVYTLGFFSILLFGLVLASSGWIVSAIFDDMARRGRFGMLTKPGPACLMWGMLYYGWMVVLAATVRGWKRNRLQDDDFSFASGYWFAYISTTTIGLGDIFLEPEVLIWNDMITFPVIFLVGFVLLAAFLGKLAELVGTHLLGSGKTTVLEMLLDRLEHVSPGWIPCWCACCCCRRPSDKSLSGLHGQIQNNANEVHDR